MSNETERCAVCGDAIVDSGIRKINVKITKDDNEHIGPVRGLDIDGTNYRVCDQCSNIIAIVYTLSNCEHTPFKVSLTHDEPTVENRD